MPVCAGRGDAAGAIIAKIEQGGDAGAAANKEAADAQARLAQNPNDQAASAQLNKAQETRRAADEFRDKAAAQYPDSFDVQKAAAGAAVKEEDWSGAVEYGKRSVDLAGDDPARVPGALKNLAMGQFKMGDYPGAAAAAKRALDLRPSDVKLAGELMALYQNSKGRAAAGTRSAPVATPATAAAAPAASAQGAAVRAPAAYATVSTERLKANDFAAQAGASFGMDRSRARNLVEKALQLDPGNAAAYQVKARIASAEGDFQAALDALDRAIAADPKNTSAYRERAEVRAALKQQRDRIEADFLASGGAQPDFSAFYEQAMKRAEEAGRGDAAASSDAQSGRGGGSAEDSFWGRLCARRLAGADWLELLGLLAVLGAAYAALRSAWRRKAG